MTQFLGCLGFRELYPSKFNPMTPVQTPFSGMIAIRERSFGPRWSNGLVDDAQNIARHEQQFERLAGVRVG